MSYLGVPRNGIRASNRDSRLPCPILRIVPRFLQLATAGQSISMSHPARLLMFLKSSSALQSAIEASDPLNDVKAFVQRRGTGRVKPCSSLFKAGR